ncbi:MAG: tail fiber domain-containing protein [Geobacteraceae bacterium]|nr:tail fiber domain-containing protein [Geobacteraceae bacterium]
MKPSHLTTLLALTTAFVLAVAAFAAVPGTINYQGYLKNTDGTPVKSPTSIRFSLYSSNPPRNDNYVWRETQPAVDVANGIYSTQLGSATPLAAPFDVPYWLGVKIEGDAEMDLQPLSSVPYALRAGLANAVPAASIGTPALLDSSVTTAKIAAGAVTDSQISGTISAAKLDLSGVQKKYAKVAVVAQSGGDYSDPATAMGDVATWCGTPSAANPCLLKIMPGVYTVTSAVAMQPYIDIEGSGEKVTKITSVLSSDLLQITVATLRGADNAELRSLTVENTGTGNYTVAILNTSVSPSLLHVTATALGSTSYGVYNVSFSFPTMTHVTARASGGGLSYGVYNSSSSPTMMNVTATAEGSGGSFGVYNDTSLPKMTNVTAKATGGLPGGAGIYNSVSSPTMMNVIAMGEPNNYGVYNTNSSPTMTDVTATGIVGVSNGLSSSPTMMNVTATGWEAGVSNHSSSPTMMNVTATGNLHGVKNTSSSPTMKNVIAIAKLEGGPNTNTYGVLNDQSSPTMTDVTATATGATANYGVKNNASSLVMSNVTAKGSGGTSNYGMYSSSLLGPYTILIDRSTFEGSTNSIYNDTYSTIKIGASKLIGPRNVSGTYTYSGTYDDTGTVTAAAFSGDGSGLTNVVSTVSNGVYTTGSYADPAWITSLAGSKIVGPIPDGKLSSNVALLDTSQTFSNSKTFTDSGLLLRNSSYTFSTTLRAPNATVARTVSLPDASGTVITTGNLSGITSVGTITSGTWNSTAILPAYGGTGATTAAAALTNLGAVAKAGDTMTGILNLPANGLVVGTNQLVASSGRIGIGTATPNEQLEITGNLRLPATTATTGMIKSGASTLIHTYGTNSFFAGALAGNLTQTGSNITAIGNSALHSNTTGYNNTAVGASALMENTTGNYNAATGGMALYGNIDGSWNTANGFYALLNNIDGKFNTAVGGNALTSNTSGSYNTALGYIAGSTGANANTTGSNNTFIGAYSGPGTTSQLTNATAVGYNALVNQSNSLVLGGTGTDAVNVGIGTKAPAATLTVVNSAAATKGVTIQGAASQTANLQEWQNSTGAALVSVNSAGNIRNYNNDVYFRDGTDINHGLGWYGTGKTFATVALDGPVLYGWSGGVLGTTNGGQKIMLKWDTGGFDFYGYSRFRVLSSGSTSACLDANNSISACSSDARMKKDVVPLSESMDVLGALSKLRGVTFTWDKSNEKAAGMAEGRDLGMIAQEVEAVFPEVVHTDKDGYKFMDYPKLVAFLIEVGKQQQKQLTGQKEELGKLSQIIAEMNRRLSAVESR